MRRYETLCALVALTALIDAIPDFVGHRPPLLGYALLPIVAGAVLLMFRRAVPPPAEAAAVDDDALARIRETAQRAEASASSADVRRLEKELRDAATSWQRRCDKLDALIDEALHARQASPADPYFSSFDSGPGQARDRPDATDRSAAGPSSTASASLPSAMRDPLYRRELLLAVQEAADDVLSSLMSVDAALLTARVQAALAPRFAGDEAGTLRICAHSSLTDLRAEFSDPDFLSVVRPDGNGWLIPHRRAGYAHPSSRFFDGDSRRWPRFEEAAECRVDGGKATLTKKGVL